MNGGGSKPKRLFVSFSGGRTSGRMLDICLSRRADYDEMVVGFANSTQEDPRTLEFVDQVDRRWKAGVVWLEAVVDPARGAGTRHKVVSFETANRTGASFEEAIKKYGIPNRSYPGTCTRELKLRPMDSYLRSIGWEAGSYDTAIGIRADEIDRMNESAAALRIIYPLVRLGVTKADVLAWWRKQPFDLQVPEHMGNCVWCWKKSLRKHLTLAVDQPSAFDFPARMERLYANAGAGTGERRFFRENRTVADLFELAKQPFERFEESRQLHLPLTELDMPSGTCSESCDINEAMAEAA